MTNRHLFNQLYFRAGRALEEIRNTSSVRTGQVDEVNNLLYEIQIYQVELIAQMHDLKQAYDVIKETRNKYRNLFNSASVGYLTSDSKGAILQVNQVAARLLNMPEEDIIGSAFSTYLDLKSQDVYYLHRRAVLATGQRQICTVSFVHSGSSHSIQLQTSMHHHPSKTLQTAIIDVPPVDTGQNTTALTDLSSLFEPDTERHIIQERILQAIQRIIPHDEAFLTLPENNTASGLPRPYEACIQQMADGQEIVTVEQMPVPSDARRGQQSYMGVKLVSGSVIAGYLHLMRHPVDSFTPDEQRRLLEFARVAAAALQQAQPSERHDPSAAVQGSQRMTRSLHDGIVQSVFACRMLAESAKHDAQTRFPALSQPVHEISNLTESILNEMQVLQRELYPDTLNDMTLPELLTEYVCPIEARRGFELSLNLADDITLPPPVRVSLYRIAQEALNNIDRHAQAAQVRITLVAVDDGVLLEITDDGTGFDSLHVKASGGGLAMIQQHANRIDATLKVTSHEDAGTHVAVFWRT